MLSTAISCSFERNNVSSQKRKHSNNSFGIETYQFKKLTSETLFSRKSMEVRCLQFCSQTLESINRRTERFARGGRDYGSNILLKSRTRVNKLLFCFSCLVVRLGEARLWASNAKGDATEKVQERLPQGLNLAVINEREETRNDMQHFTQATVVCHRQAQSCQPTTAGKHQFL